MAEEKFRHESLQDRESIGKYLNALSDGFQNGKLQFSWKDKRLVLEPQSLIKFDIETMKTDGEVKMTLRFRWEQASESSMFVDGPLVIDSQAKG
ncbi:amphi-Trp domain-containing protein [Desulfonatronum thiosulfatophilum]|uniref:Amphi-Trp domain-containing protein n=1 Tax=Desulfonatronum thiosulfatophilum TaxID=617002 RepID=A0A1G6AJC2_9BACT|nr:amphi-Trp domain-containing protein [Desulfonatronum thiosulfatophilum]SDB08475.1 amphi-Trp domain-containing protein [Desulfonatronum thiosulfatophilum]